MCSLSILSRVEKQIQVLFAQLAVLSFITQLNANNKINCQIFDKKIVFNIRCYIITVGSKMHLYPKKLYKCEQNIYKSGVNPTRFAYFFLSISKAYGKIQHADIK